MLKTFENRPTIGYGIYTMPDVSRILDIPNYKVNRWVKKYWDEDTDKFFTEKYSWKIDNSKAVSFHTLVELYTFINLNESGVTTGKVHLAHNILSKRFKTNFPFATSHILNNLKTDGKKVYLKNEDDTIITLDGTNQLNFNFISVFFKKLDFDENELACRLWPLGKKKSIICDPKRQFGHPVIYNTNIHPETIFDMYSAGDSKRMIAATFGLKTKNVNDAIAYCEKAA